MKTIQQYIKKTQSVFEQAFDSKIRDAYNTLPLPSKKLEDWKFFNSSNWFSDNWNFDSQSQLTQDFISSIISSISFDALFVFENGKFLSQFSQNSTNTIEFKSLAEISKHKKINETEIIASHIPISNTFEAINLLTAQDGAYLTIEKSNQIQNIIIVSANSGNQTFSQTQNSIILKQGAQANITEIIVSFSDSVTLANNLTGITCHNNASCEYSTIQKLHNTSNVIHSVIISQASNSLITCNSFPLTGKNIRANIRIFKDGEHANTNINGLFFPTKDEQFETYTWVYHNKPECETHELFKGIANENGQGIFSGLIYVARDAQKTLATQSNRNILLSDSAKIHSKPQLEIYADDVSCNHGSTTGQINKDALWYMQARGINRQDATKLLLEGFVNEVVQKVSNEQIQSIILSNIKEKL